jgi:glycosyltransferase involved in cell wall biosynthesis
MEPRLRVLHCIPTLGGGGAERQLAYLGPALCALGLDVHLATVSGGSNLARMRDSPVVIHRIPVSDNHDPRLLLRLLSLARRIRPDIIQTWIPQMDVLGGLAARLSGTVHVLTERCGAEAYGSTWKDAARRLVGRYADLVVANSDHGKAYWDPIRLARPTFVVRNGVPSSEITSSIPSRQGLEDFPSAVPVILGAGRYAPQKNFLTLLSALEQVLLEEPSAVAVLFGEGPLQDSIAERARTHPFSDRIRVFGFSENLWGLLKEASVFVSPSLFEGSPNTVLEAMAAGCPLVVSDIPPHLEILDPASALIVDALSPKAIAGAIVATLRDRPAAGRRAAAAARRVAEFSVEASAARYADIYRLLAARTRGLRASPSR